MTAIKIMSTMPWTVKIKTNTLLIREFREKDRPYTESLYGDPISMKLFFHGVPYSPERTAEFLAENTSSVFEKGSPFGLHTVYLRGTKSFLGHIYLKQDENGDVDIGIIFSHTNHRTGLGYQSMMALKAYLLELRKKYQFGRILATAHPENFGSQKLLRAAGFEQIGSITRYDQPRNIYYLDENKDMSLELNITPSMD